MATIAVPSRPRKPRRQTRVGPSATTAMMSASDLARLPKTLATGDFFYELKDGRLIVMAPPGESHGATQSQITCELILQGDRKGHGRTWTETGVLLSHSPDTVYGPDAFFVTRDRLPIETTKEGYLETIPDLVVEVRSKNDTNAKVAEKIHDYLAAGVQTVWVLDPRKKTVTVHRPHVAAHVLQATDRLTASGIIPGFSLRVADLFRD